MVSWVEINFAIENVINKIRDMPGLKNTFAKRKLGNRLVLGVAKSIGENIFDKDASFLKIIL